MNIRLIIHYLLGLINYELLFHFYSARCGWTPSKSDKKEERTDDTNVESIGDVLKKFNLIYGLSVTEMEIVRGAFMNNNPNG